MTATRLSAETVFKPWGRRDLAPWSPLTPAEPLGEMIYAAPGGDAAPLLLKALFTAERLSVQVHPDDAAARAAGLPRGKDEAWVILAAEPNATIGLGLRAAVSSATLAAAAADGSIEHMLNWLPVAAGDVLFAPAGTIHAIGAGVVVIEIQQNLDLTYRLFDYGRPRELHVADAVAVAKPGPWRRQPPPRDLGGGRWAVVEAPSFVVERVAAGGAARIAPHGPLWVAVLAGGGTLDGDACAAGEIWHLDDAAEADFAPGSDLLLTYPGAVDADLWA